MLLREETECFCFLAVMSPCRRGRRHRHRKTANKVRKKALRVILNGLGKDAAAIISRINGFTHVETEYNYSTGDLKVVWEKPYSEGDRASVNATAPMMSARALPSCVTRVDVSITGNSTNPTRFQHPVAGTYKKWCLENGKKYFSVASGGGTGRHSIPTIWLPALLPTA